MDCPPQKRMGSQRRETVSEEIVAGVCFCSAKDILYAIFVQSFFSSPFPLGGSVGFQELWIRLEKVFNLTFASYGK